MAPELHILEPLITHMSPSRVARARNPSALSMSSPLGSSAICLLDDKESADALLVVLGRAVHGPVDGDPAQVEVDVVLPGDADPAVELDAVVNERDRLQAHVRL